MTTTAAAPRHRRARQLRLLDHVHRQARRGLRELGADALALQALDQLVERQRRTLWRGGR
jgi:hypothetical protein